MKSDAERVALALVESKRPWYRPSFLLAAVILLVLAFGAQAVQLQLEQHALGDAIASATAIAKENRRLARNAADEAYHNCIVVTALVSWANDLGPLERTVTGNSDYHQKRIRAFAALHDTLLSVDGKTCVPPPNAKGI